MKTLLFVLLLLNNPSYSQDKFNHKITELNKKMKDNNTLLSNKRLVYLKKEISNLSEKVFNILADSLTNSQNVILHVEFIQSYGYSMGPPTFIFYVYDVNSKKEWIFEYEEKSKKNNFITIEKTKLSKRDIEYYEYISNVDIDKLIKLSNFYKLRITHPKDIEFEFAEFIYYLNYEERIFNTNNFMLHFPKSLENSFE